MVMRLRTLLGDHACTAALKNGSIKSDLVEFDFADDLRVTVGQFLGDDHHVIDRPHGMLGKPAGLLGLDVRK